MSSTSNLDLLLPSFATVSPWTADLGGRTYRNPIIHADYSDPDVVRSGEDYYLVSSSFHAVPGLPILHSRDLVNWTLINHALPALVPQSHFSTPRHGQGVWAPAIRHHAGKFWIFYPDPDFGIYVVTAADPTGEWSAPFLLKPGRGLIDPCPHWDKDGRLWLVHGWAKSRAGINNRITLHRVAPDASRLLDGGIVIIDADRLEGVEWLEGPKMYWRSGYFYVFAPANGVATGQQFVFRSRRIEGPYEHRIVLAQGSTPVNGPHQGAWIETPAGEHWFFHFQDSAAYGRIVHLQPMRWRDDDWPEIGVNQDAAGCGEPVLLHEKPASRFDAIKTPQVGDDFSEISLSRAWQWQANPRAEWVALDAGKGRLRLTAVPIPGPREDGTRPGGTLYDSPNLLLQKFPAPVFTACVDLNAAGLAAGEQAGLIVFGFSYAWIGLRREAEGIRLLRVTADEACDASARDVEISGPIIPAEAARLRVTVGAAGMCHFEGQIGDGDFIALGRSFVARQGRWVGAKVGVFCVSPCGAQPGGHADFARFSISN